MICMSLPMPRPPSLSPYASVCVCRRTFMPARSALLYPGSSASCCSRLRAASASACRLAYRSSARLATSATRDFSTCTRTQSQNRTWERDHIDGRAPAPSRRPPRCAKHTQGQAECASSPLARTCAASGRTVSHCLPAAAAAPPPHACRSWQPARCPRPRACAPRPARTQDCMSSGSSSSSSPSVLTSRKASWARCFFFLRSGGKGRANADRSARREEHTGKPEQQRAPALLLTLPACP